MVTCSIGCFVSHNKFCTLFFLWVQFTYVTLVSSFWQCCLFSFETFSHAVLPPTQWASTQDFKARVWWAKWGCQGGDFTLVAVWLLHSCKVRPAYSEFISFTLGALFTSMENFPCIPHFLCFWNLIISIAKKSKNFCTTRNYVMFILFRSWYSSLVPWLSYIYILIHWQSSKCWVSRSELWKPIPEEVLMGIMSNVDN